MPVETFTDFYEAYDFLREHHIFENTKTKQVDFQSALDIQVVKVDPLTNTMKDDSKLNIKTQVWLECGPYETIPEEGFKGYTHDINLDTGGDTFEEAIISLANLVYEHYGVNPEGYREPTAEDLEKAYKFLVSISSQFSTEE